MNGPKTSMRQSDWSNPSYLLPSIGRIKKITQNIKNLLNCTFRLVGVLKVHVLIGWPSQISHHEEQNRQNFN
jgi:hypothetical protein